MCRFLGSISTSMMKRSKRDGDVTQKSACQEAESPLFQSLHCISQALANSRTPAFRQEDQEFKDGVQLALEVSLEGVEYPQIIGAVSIEESEFTLLIVPISHTPCSGDLLSLPLRLAVPLMTPRRQSLLLPTTTSQ